MFPKRGQVWTYRERGRFLAFIWAVPLIPMLTIGIYFVAAQSNWLLLVVALVALAGWALFIFSSERAHRDEP